MMKFSYNDYLNSIIDGSFKPPNVFNPYIQINRGKLYFMDKENGNYQNNIANAFNKLYHRIGEAYYNKIFPIQVKTIEYSQNTFPAYRFLIPEIINNDWLGMVDWHKKFQRDHLIHQPLTAYILLKLLTGNSKESCFEIRGKTLLDLCVEKIIEGENTRYLYDYLQTKGGPNLVKFLNNEVLKKELWKKLFLETAFLASIFHDMGYSWQFLNILSEKLNGLNYNNNFKFDVLDIIDKYGQKLFFYPLNNYAPVNKDDKIDNNELKKIVYNCLTKTHGFPGALGFTFLNDLMDTFSESNLNKPFNKELQRSDENILHKFCIEWAAMAIMMHDLERVYWGNGREKRKPDFPYLRLNISKDPLSCLIALCDLIEEFERPLVSFFPAYEGSTFTYQPACDFTELKLKNESSDLVITFVYKNPKEKIIKQTFIQNEEFYVLNSESGYINFSDIGIANIKIEVKTLNQLVEV